MTWIHANGGISPPFRSPGWAWTWWGSWGQGSKKGGEKQKDIKENYAIFRILISIKWIWRICGIIVQYLKPLSLEFHVPQSPDGGVIPKEAAEDATKMEMHIYWIKYFGAFSSIIMQKMAKLSNQESSPIIPWGISAISAICGPTSVPRLILMKFTQSTTALLYDYCWIMFSLLSLEVISFIWIHANEGIPPISSTGSPSVSEI